MFQPYSVKRRKGESLRWGVNLNLTLLKRKKPDMTARLFSFEGLCGLGQLACRPAAQELHRPAPNRDRRARRGSMTGEPMPDEFQPGDAVELIGGDGHRMIVEDVQDGIVSCVWVLNGAVVRGSFPAAALELSE